MIHFQKSIKKIGFPSSSYSHKEVSQHELLAFPLGINSTQTIKGKKDP